MLTEFTRGEVNYVGGGGGGGGGGDGAVVDRKGTDVGRSGGGGRGGCGCGVVDRRRDTDFGRLFCGDFNIDTELGGIMSAGKIGNFPSGT